MVAAALSWVGLIHAYAWTEGDTVVRLGLGAGAPWAWAYLATAVLLVSIRFIALDRDKHLS
ncbi:MAG: hypothetical protein D6760_11615 [Deltaproteobacteria bacterium]|nr:MAG: hypothetical protein D6760_11615 [Deltaproteobacteria bacterium]